MADSDAVDRVATPWPSACGRGSSPELRAVPVGALLKVLQAITLMLKRFVLACDKLLLNISCLKPRPFSACAQPGRYVATGIHS